ncbi:MAG: bifunctional DNA-formamidopyrimidine glycosylase/DNA-(apurinic or apyrimidinic site) lyase [Thermoanaerobaculum sp.]
MPELPEVETVRRALAALLSERTLVAVRVGDKPLRWPLATENLESLVGSPLVRVARRGKYLLFVFSRQILVGHLGMSGRFFLDAGGDKPVHGHLFLEFSGGVRVVYVDPRRFGFFVVVPQEGLENHPVLASLGPEPFATDAVTDSLLASRKKRRAPVRNVLLDQSVVAGVGNIYANEALFAAGIAPQRPISSLSKKRIQRLALALREVVEQALVAGGTTLRDGGFRDLLGNPGYFAVNLAVYGRQGRPCPRCKTPIRRLLVAGRGAYFCPRCQR